MDAINVKKELQTVTLEELKLYARIDGDEDDSVLLDAALSSENTVEQVLGFPLSDFEEIPDLVKQVVYVIATRRYENRLGETIAKDTILARNLLLNYRYKKW